MTKFKPISRLSPPSMETCDIFKMEPVRLLVFLAALLKALPLAQLLARWRGEERNDDREMGLCCADRLRRGRTLVPRRQLHGVRATILGMLSLLWFWE